jgi:sialate O-acetylesterase
MNRARLSILVIIILSCGQLSRADIRLADGFGSGMILQRDVPTRLSGYADQGEEVTVRIGDHVVGEAIGAGPGQLWHIALPVFQAGPVGDITVTGKNEVTLTNLLAGDVWVCAGQSNMAMTLTKGSWCPYGGVLNAEQEVAAADHPRIRLFTSSGKEGWTACTPESAKSFSAAGYFFGRELQRELDVPIGLVQTAVGGTPAEYWTPRAAREAWPGFAAELESARRVLRELKPIFDADRKAWAEWRKTSQEAQKSGLPISNAPDPKLTAEQEGMVRAAIHVDTTGQGYAARVKPLTLMRVKGVLWYQGEANAARAEQYAELMTQLISGWRADWGQPDLPFVIMQLVNFGGGSGAWPALRAAQQRVVKTVPHASLAVGIDIGDSKNIHPKNKQDVGKRLALAALKDVYKKDVVSSGPVVQSAEFNNGKVTLMFDSCGEGQQLVFNPGEGSGFELAGVDGVFLPASVEQNEDTLILLAAGMNAPQVMRYAWSDNPVATLFNTAGLPAAPFQEFKKGNAR